jgi:cytochrome c-type biogenesis protein CcmE
MQNATLGKLAITAAVAIGGLGFLVYSSAAQAQHYRMVDDLIGDGLEHWRDKELKVHGWVEAGTIVQAVVDHEMHQTFVLEKNGKRIRIFSKGPIPDTFKDRAEVVATGHLVAPGPLQPVADTMCASSRTGCPVRAGAEQAWVLDATDVSAKCPTHYDGAAANKIQRDVPFE